MEKNNENADNQSISKAVANEMETTTTIFASEFLTPPPLFTSADPKHDREEIVKKEQELEGAATDEQVHVDEIKTPDADKNQKSTSPDIQMPQPVVKEDETEEEIKDSIATDLLFADEAPQSPNDLGDEENGGAAGADAGSGDGDENPIQRKPLNGQETNTQQQGSKQLPDGVMAKMEASMASDFSNVKIIQNSQKAVDSGALAFAQGNTVHFAPGQYNPSTSTGQKLLGHELAHVKQQRLGKVKPTTSVNGMPVNDDPALEKAADEEGEKAANYTLQKQAEDTKFDSAELSGVSQLKLGPYKDGYRFANDDNQPVQGVFPLIVYGLAALAGAVTGVGVGAAVISTTDGHRDRNALNRFPVGILRDSVSGATGNYTYVEGGTNVYVDDNQTEWRLLADSKNIFHQPEGTPSGQYPNKKFLSFDPYGGSYEAILQPNEDGTYSNNWLNSGDKQGTYNYYDPDTAPIGHVFMDVLPHLVPGGGNYSATPVGQQKSKDSTDFSDPAQLKSEPSDLSNNSRNTPDFSPIQRQDDEKKTGTIKSFIFNPYDYKSNELGPTIIKKFIDTFINERGEGMVFELTASGLGFFQLGPVPAYLKAGLSLSFGMDFMQDFTFLVGANISSFGGIGVGKGKSSKSSQSKVGGGVFASLGYTYQWEFAGSQAVAGSIYNHFVDLNQKIADSGLAPKAISQLLIPIKDDKKIKVGAKKELEVIDREGGGEVFGSVKKGSNNEEKSLEGAVKIGARTSDVTHKDHQDQDGDGTERTSTESTYFASFAGGFDFDGYGAGLAVDFSRTSVVGDPNVSMNGDYQDLGYTISFTFPAETAHKFFGKWAPKCNPLLDKTLSIINSLQGFADTKITSIVQSIKSISQKQEVQNLGKKVLEVLQMDKDNKSSSYTIGIPFNFKWQLQEDQGIDSYQLLKKSISLVVSKNMGLGNDNLNLEAGGSIKLKITGDIGTESLYFIKQTYIDAPEDPEKKGVKPQWDSFKEKNSSSIASSIFNCVYNDGAGPASNSSAGNSPSYVSLFNKIKGASGDKEKFCKNNATGMIAHLERCFQEDIQERDLVGKEVRDFVSLLSDIKNDFFSDKRKLEQVVDALRKQADDGGTKQVHSFIQMTTSYGIDPLEIILIMGPYWSTIARLFFDKHGISYKIFHQKGTETKQQQYARNVVLATQYLENNDFLKISEMFRYLSSDSDLIADLSTTQGKFLLEEEGYPYSFLNGVMYFIFCLKKAKKYTIDTFMKKWDDYDSSFNSDAQAGYTGTALIILKAGYNLKGGEISEGEDQINDNLLSWYTQRAQEGNGVLVDESDDFFQGLSNREISLIYDLFIYGEKDRSLQTVLTKKSKDDDSISKHPVIWLFNVVFKGISAENLKVYLNKISPGAGLYIGPKLRKWGIDTDTPAPQLIGPASPESDKKSATPIQPKLKKDTSPLSTAGSEKPSINSESTPQQLKENKVIPASVNIHAESKQASEMGALAFAQGSDIHFAPGQFQPDSRSGQELLGHELAHVGQQAKGNVKPTTQYKGLNVNTDRSLEKEADEFGVKFADSLQNNDSSPVQNMLGTGFSSNSTPVQKKEVPNLTTPGLFTPATKNQKAHESAQLKQSENLSHTKQVNNIPASEDASLNSVAAEIHDKPVQQKTDESNSDLSTRTMPSAGFSLTEPLQQKNEDPLHLTQFKLPNVIQAEDPESRRIRVLIDGGQTNENVLTNEVFYDRHPELERRRLTMALESSELDLRNEWFEIRNRKVRPILDPTRVNSEQDQVSDSLDQSSTASTNETILENTDLAGDVIYQNLVLVPGTSLIIGGNLSIAGTLDNAGTIVVGGNIIIGGHIASSGHLSAGNSISVTGDVSNAGRITAGSAVTFGQNLNSSGRIMAGSEVTVANSVATSKAIIAPHVSVGNSLSCAGSLDSRGSLTVGAVISVGGDLIASKNVSAGDSIIVGRGVVLNNSAISAGNSVAVGMDATGKGRIVAPSITIGTTGSYTNIHLVEKLPAISGDIQQGSISEDEEQVVAPQSSVPGSGEQISDESQIAHPDVNISELRAVQYELVAHGLAYTTTLNSEQNDLLLSWGFQANWRPKLDFNDQDGFFAGLLLPIEGTANSDLEDPLMRELYANNHPILAFRGSETSTRPDVGFELPQFIKDWLWNDMDPIAVGYTAFATHQDKIRKLLMGAIKATGKKVVVTGHSLGGSLAKQCAIHFPQFVHACYTYQAPGINEDQQQHLEQNANNQVDANGVGLTDEDRAFLERRLSDPEEANAVNSDVYFESHTSEGDIVHHAGGGRVPGANRIQHDPSGLAEGLSPLAHTLLLTNSFQEGPDGQTTSVYSEEQDVLRGMLNHQTGNNVTENQGLYEHASQAPNDVLNPTEMSQDPYTTDSTAHVAVEMLRDELIAEIFNPHANIIVNFPNRIAQMPIQTKVTILRSLMDGPGVLETMIKGAGLGLGVHLLLNYPGTVGGALAGGFAAFSETDNGAAFAPGAVAGGLVGGALSPIDGTPVGPLLAGAGAGYLAHKNGVGGLGSLGIGLGTAAITSSPVLSSAAGSLAFTYFAQSNDISTTQQAIMLMLERSSPSDRTELIQSLGGMIAFYERMDTVINNFFAPENFARLRGFMRRDYIT